MLKYFFSKEEKIPASVRARPEGFANSRDPTCIDPRSNTPNYQTGFYTENNYKKKEGEQVESY